MKLSIKNITVPLAIMLIFLFFTINIPGICFAVDVDDNDDVPESRIEMLDHTDILKAANLLKSNYYKSLDVKKLLVEFVRGVQEFAPKKGKIRPLKDIIVVGDVKQVAAHIGEAFRKSGIKKKEMQSYIHAGIRQMVKSLDNPGCKFALPGKYRETLEEMGYNKGGCGFFVDEKNRDHEGRWIIIETLQDFPADKEGIKSGDRLMLVNGKSVIGTTFKELAKIVRGPIGSKVILTVYRPSESRKVNIHIKRTWLGPNPRSIRTEILPGNIGYIKFRYLGERMAPTIADVYKKFGKKKVKGVIWDFRNSAGLLDGAIDLSSRYVPKDKNFICQMFLDEKTCYKGTSPEMKDLPDVIILNKYTSSTTILLALVLKKYKKVPLLGRPMEWDGDRDKSHRLRDGSYITIPYSYYKIIDGPVLSNKTKIKPDVDVGQHPLPPFTSGDKQLEKAVEMIKEKAK